MLSAQELVPVMLTKNLRVLSDVAGGGRAGKGLSLVSSMATRE